MNYPDDYRNVLLMDRPWTDEERNTYRCAKLQIAHKTANGIYLNAFCMLITGIAIYFFLWSIAAVFTKMKTR